jgi:hypothetical protein
VPPSEKPDHAAKKRPAEPADAFEETAFLMVFGIVNIITRLWNLIFCLVFEVCTAEGFLTLSSTRRVPFSNSHSGINARFDDGSKWRAGLNLS